MSDQAKINAPQRNAATTKGAGGILQRKCACGTHTIAGGACDSCREQTDSTRLQRAATKDEPPDEVPPVVHQVLRSSGRPLDVATRAFLEPRFRHDFSGVRVHTDGEAADAARAAHARAYTVGREIVFGQGEFAPSTSEGRRLLAHELTHVIQQEGYAVPNGLTTRYQHTPGPSRPAPETAVQAVPAVKSLTGAAQFEPDATRRPHARSGELRVSRPADTAEREAEAAADAVMAGRSPALTHGAAAPALYRQAKAKPKPKILPPDAKAFVRKHGRGELTPFLDKVITDGEYREVFKEDIDGVEHIWEIRAIDYPKTEAQADFAGATGKDGDVSEANGKRVRHRWRVILRSGLSTNETVLHELIHLRIGIDKEMSEEKRSSFYGEYSQMMEIATDEAGLGLLTGVPAKKRELLAAIEQLRKFFIETVDPHAKDKLEGDPAVQPDVLVEFVVNEKYVNQTSSAVYYSVKLNNETLAERYSKSVARRFRELCDSKAVTSRLGHPIGESQYDALVLSLKKALVAFYDQIDLQKKAIEDFKQNPPSPPGDMVDPQIFESRPLQIGGAPAPLPAELGGK